MIDVFYPERGGGGVVREGLSILLSLPVLQNLYLMAVFDTIDHPLLHPVYIT